MASLFPPVSLVLQPFQLLDDEDNAVCPLPGNVPLDHLVDDGHGQTDPKTEADA